MLHRCTKDKSSITGKNIDSIMRDALDTDFKDGKRSIFSLVPKRYKSSHKFHQLSDDERWKVELIKDMVELRREKKITRSLHEVNDATINLEEIGLIINDVCTN